MLIPSLRVLYEATSETVDIYADRRAFGLLADCLATGEGTIEADTGFDPLSAEEKRLARIVVHRDESSLVVFDVDNDTLAVRGSLASLQLFGENVAGYGNEMPDGSHLHVEWHDDHFYLAGHSLFVTIALSTYPGKKL